MSLQIATRELLSPAASAEWSRYLQTLPLANRDEIAEALAIRETQLRELEKLRFAMKEVTHRAKNIVSVLQSLARQTMRESRTKEEFDERYSARLAAYCSSLDVLIANDWRGMSVHDVVRSQLAHFGAGDEAQITYQGPTVTLTPNAARCIGLALHELATNAAKYGSLTTLGGTVSVTWQIEFCAGCPRLRMEWLEAGGPNVSPPTHRGFGTRVIEQVTALSSGSRLIYEFPPAGVRWAIDVDARDVLVATPAQIAH